MIHINNFANGALNPAMSYVVSCVGCFLGLRCTTRARAYQGAARARWLTLAALSIGTTGIWVMHFIAMLGFAIPGETIRYNVPFTILSMVIAVIVVGIGVFIVGFSRRAGNGPLAARRHDPRARRGQHALPRHGRRAGDASLSYNSPSSRPP
jgi:MHYT domain (predicted integral membrane sensor domain)